MDTDTSHINNGSLHRRRPARCCSPAPSSESMNSDRSIGLPCNFNGEVPHPDDSCYESMKSDFSMDIPINFKEGGPLRGDSDSSCLLTAADHVRCFVCPSILRQPAVSIACSYCKRCVDTRSSRDYVCPRCDEVLNWLQAGYCGGPACDVCSSETRPAIKTCVTCDASYCENHIRHHYTVPALQRHTLTPVNYDTLTLVNYDTLTPVNYDTLSPVS